MKLISIITPTKDRRELLKQTIASVRAQTYPHWECLVVDDSSTDGTPEAVEQLGREEPRIRLLRRAGAQGGASACRNQGFAAARGDYVVFLDSDDLLAAFCLEQRVNVMQANPETEFAAFPYIFFRDHPADTKHVRMPFFTAEDDLARFLKKDNVWNISGPIWRRSTLERLGSWDESLLSGQEWDLTIRALTQHIPYLKFDEPDWFYRVAGSRTTIGSHWFEPASLANRQAQLFAIAQRVQAAGMLTTARRYACLTTFLQESMILVWHKQMAAALKFWMGIRRDPVLAPTPALHTTLLVFLVLQRVRFVRRLAAGLLAPWLPAEFRFAVNAYKRVPYYADPNCRALRACGPHDLM